MTIKKIEDFQYLSGPLDRTIHDVLEKINKPIIGRKFVSENYTVTSEDFIGVTTANGAVTITLPAPLNYENQIKIIKDEGGNAGTNNITVSFASGENNTIDGSSSAIISTNYGVLRLYATSSEWFSF